MPDYKSTAIMNLYTMVFLIILTYAKPTFSCKTIETLNHIFLQDEGMKIFTCNAYHEAYKCSHYEGMSQKYSYQGVLSFSQCYCLHGSRYGSQCGNLFALNCTCKITHGHTYHSCSWLTWYSWHSRDWGLHLVQAQKTSPKQV